VHSGEMPINNQIKSILVYFRNEFISKATSVYKPAYSPSIMKDNLTLS